MQETERLGLVDQPWTGLVDQADIPALRAAFAALMDRAAERIYPTGYDQDDVILERFVVLHDATDVDAPLDPVDSTPQEWTVPLPLLGEPQDIVRALDVHRRERRLPPCRPAAVTFAALQIAILRETNIPLPDLRVPWNYDPKKSG